ncbi:hypothetical protein [Deinococcus arenicola]|uniref:Lipoprotein n=1 Tax=Deinococcus arenicola TaxID=2994950 RepID=A0ABU4DTI7_9DEIO|nr:hypothetical protein [Deinococcus sp. ZS9-10]MDV6375277.1 hypothetical protein [Deinococcus sp. ZS9-10]
MKKPHLLSALTLSLILASCAAPSTPVETAAGAAQTGMPAASEAKVDDVTTPVGIKAFADVSTMLPGPDRSKLPTNARLGEARILQGTRLSAQALPANAQTDVVALKVLILSSGAGDYGLDSAKAILQESGVPYDVLDASQTALSQDSLIDADGSGKYQGIILTSNALVADDGTGAFVSALDSSEWDTLFQYEAAYKARQLALFGYPGVAPEDYGLRAVAGAETSTTSMTPNSAGKGVFKDLTGTAVPVQYAFSYPSTLETVPGVTTTPLMTDPQGRVLAATSTAADGRERLLITTAQNPYLLHTELMGYGMVQWLTKGVHLGEHRRFLQVDIDDYFLDGDHLNAATGTLYAKPFRVSSSDVLSISYQQAALRNQFKVAKDFKYAMAFNGGGASTSIFASCLNFFASPDALTSMTKCLQNDFDWVNHTKNHLRMDVMDLKTANDQIAGNFTVASKLGLPVNRKSLVTGEHSGLGNMDPNDDGTNDDAGTVGPKQDLGLGRSNPNLLQAAANSGVNYIASDRSVASQRDDSCSTCGVVHPLNNNIFLVPRWPTNMHYHVTNPAEALRSYNGIYAPGGTRPYWDHALTYAEFLDKDSDVSLSHILGGGAFPHYMHQPNLDQYASGKSLASDWVNAALTKYTRYSTLPLNTYKWDDLGAYMKSHTAEEKAKAMGGVRGRWNRMTSQVIVINTSGSMQAITLTGSKFGNLYGAYRASVVKLSTGSYQNVSVSTQ